MTKQIKRDTKLVFRVPGKLQRAIRDGAAKSLSYEHEDAEGKKASRADFVIDAVEAFIEKIQDGATVEDLALPPGFIIPKGDTSMMSIRVSAATMEFFDQHASRFYHSRTQFVLWAVMNRVQEMVEEKKQRAQ